MLARGEIIRPALSSFSLSRRVIKDASLHNIKAGGSEMKQTNSKNRGSNATKKSVSKRSSSACSDCGKSK